jgi:hypothetical protein
MFRVDRAIPAVILLVAGLSLSACSSSGGNFDPTEWIPDDMFGAKPKLAGDRKPVFPEGVPGVPEGVPKEMVKGNQQAAVEDPTVIPAEQAPAAKPARPARPQATRPPPKPRTASAPPQPAPARTSAPPPQPAQSAAPAPAWPEPNAQANWPPPSPDTFSR